MAKSKESKSIITKKKSSYLAGLKALSNWLFSKRNEQELEHIVQKYEFDTTILKRLVSYVYNSPHIVWYINRYLNNLYDFNKYNIISLMYSFSYLLDINQKNQSKKLFYLKSNELADKNKSKVKDLLDEYFSRLYDKHYNIQELNFYYDLINLGFIPMQDITTIDTHINSGKTTVIFDELTLQQKSLQPIALNLSVLDIYKLLPDNISQFCNEIKTRILTRKECQKCELFGKPTVILDTNMTDFGEVDIAFIGLNPGKEEAELNRPFVGKSGNLLREKISHLPADIKWVIGNIILCHTRNEKDIKKPDEVISNCNDLLAEIYQKFPAKCYIPLGAKATKVMGINESITSVSGKKLTSESCTIIPIIHPSSAVNYGQMDKFVKDFETIYELFKVEKPEIITKSKQIIKQSEINIPQTRFITQVTSDLTLFDIREVNNKIIKIFIDKDSNKKYLIEDYIFNFYIKYGDWKTCSQITNKVDACIQIAGQDKITATKKVRDKLNQIKGI